MRSLHRSAGVGSSLRSYYPRSDGEEAILSPPCEANKGEIKRGFDPLPQKTRRPP
jgi:hypothetical protein